MQMNLAKTSAIFWNTMIKASSHMILHIFFFTISLFSSSKTTWERSWCHLVLSKVPPLHHIQAEFARFSKSLRRAVVVLWFCVTILVYVKQIGVTMSLTDVGFFV